jgi:hypothetical protein
MGNTHLCPEFGADYTTYTQDGKNLVHHLSDLLPRTNTLGFHHVGQVFQAI